MYVTSLRPLISSRIVSSQTESFSQSLSGSGLLGQSKSESSSPESPYTSVRKITKLLPGALLSR